MASFPAEVEVRAVIEGQMMARKMYMELRGMHIGTVFLFSYHSAIANTGSILLEEFHQNIHVI